MNKGIFNELESVYAELVQHRTNKVANNVIVPTITYKSQFDDLREYNMFMNNFLYILGELAERLEYDGDVDFTLAQFVDIIPSDNRELANKATSLAIRVVLATTDLTKVYLCLDTIKTINVLLKFTAELYYNVEEVPFEEALNDLYSPSSIEFLDGRDILDLLNEED